MTSRAKAAAALAGVFVGLLAVLAVSTPASAHAALLRTSPVSGSVVSTAPTDVVLTFSESISPVPGKIHVLGPDGARADRGDPVVRGAVISVPVRTDVPRGTYLVTYRVISADSHPVAGGFTYSVGEASATQPGVPEQSRTDPVLRTVASATKYIGYAGLVLIVGPALVLATLWPRRLSRQAPARLAWIGLCVTWVGAIVEVIVQAPYETGGGITASSLRDVLGSPFGTAHIIRLGVIAAAAFLLRPVLADRAGTADRALLAILAVIGVATWPLAGHSAVSPLPAVTVVADSAHVAGMAVWLGGLMMLVVFLLRQANDKELTAILPIWSRWAALAVSVLLLAGTVQALVEIGTVSALFRTGYGQLVLIKVALVGVVLAVAAFSRRSVQRNTAPAHPGRLRRLVGMELAISMVIVGVAAVLVQQPPARTPSAQTATQPGAQTVAGSLTDKLFTLQFDIYPAQKGLNSLHLYAYAPDGKPVRVLEWKATASLPSAGVDSVGLPLLQITDNHAIGEITLPTSGSWEFRFTLRLSDVDQSTVGTTVDIG